ncbi:MAG: hypothetical protein NTV22_00685 [bacterium]|nr:hypothetical protein [bacterium]
MKRTIVLLAVALPALFMAAASAEETFQGDAAYRQLLRAADPAAVVEVNGQRYVRAPQGVAALPGGYNGAFEKRTLTMPNGQVIVVIDPAKPLRITKDAKPATYVQLPERGLKIAAAMEKIGLRPKAELLPQAIGGYRIEVKIGEEKAGKTFTSLFIHVGKDDTVKGMALFAFANALVGESQKRKVALPPPWAGESNQHVKDDGMGILLGGNCIIGSGAAYATRNDVALNVKIIRFDTQTLAQFNQALRAQGLSFDDSGRREIDRSVELSTGLNTASENWLKILAKIVDEVDGVAAAPVVAAATPPLTNAPVAVPLGPPVVAPVVPPKPKPKPTPRELFGSGPAPLTRPPKPGVGTRIQNWWGGVEDYAAANPNRWAGWCLTSSGVGVMAVSLFVPGVGWTVIGASLFACGVGAYHGGKGQPPPEVAIVAEARERLQHYQQEWKHGFTDTELNQLGIFMDDLSKLTPAQRRQVYKDADVEFTTRADAFRQMREDEARERAGK